VSGRESAKHLFVCITIAVVAFVLAVEPVRASSIYTDVSLSYYNRFLGGLKNENFQRYHVLRGGYQDDTFDININFNMFEDVNGPIADHNINPFTLESTWQLTEHDEIQANCLYLTDVHSKGDSFVEAALEGKYKHTWQKDRWLLSIVPILRATSQNDWSLRPSLGAAISYQTPKALWSLELNGLDLKDYAILSRGTNVLTAKVTWPTWKNTKMSIGLNALLGEAAGSPLPHGLDDHQEEFWVDMRVFFDHLAVWQIN